MGRPRKTPVEPDPEVLLTRHDVRDYPDDRLEPTMREHAKELEAAGILEPLGELDALEVRVAELEQRIAEAGRRALFHARNSGSRVAPVGPILEAVGRALLFDTETPDGEALEAELDAGAGVSGSAEVTTLTGTSETPGGDAA